MPKLKNLTAKHWQGIKLKWRGNSYQEIADKLGVSIDTVEFWFRRKNGLLLGHYEDFVDDEIIKYTRRQKNKTRKNPQKPTFLHVF